MYPRTSWELVADLLGTGHTLGTARLRCIRSETNTQIYIYIYIYIYINSKTECILRTPIHEACLRISTTGSHQTDIVTRSLQQGPQVLFLRTVLKLSARAVFALLSLDKEWSQSVRVSICCSVRSILAHCCSRSYVAAQGSKASASNRRQMCLLPPSRASNNILKGKIYRPSLLPFLSLSLSLFLSPSPTFCFLYLVPSSLTQEFIQLLSDSVFCLCMVSLTVFFPCSPTMYCGAIPLASPRHHFTNYPSLYSSLYLSEMIFDPSQGSWNWRGN